MAHNSLVSQPLTPEMRSPVGSHSASATLLRAAVAVTTLAGAEILRARHARKYAPATVADYDEDRPPVLGFGGLTRLNGDFVNGISSVDNPASVTYGSQVTPHALGRTLADTLSMRHTGSVGIAAHSMGAMIGLGAFTEAVKLGVEVPKIENLWLISSPYCSRDVYNSRLYRHLPAVVHLIGGPVCKLVGSVATHGIEKRHPVSSLYESVRESIADGDATVSAEVWAEQLRRLFDAPQDLRILREAEVITSETNVRMHYERDDPVIRTASAVPNWVDAFSDIGVKASVTVFNSAVHANFGSIDPSFWGADRSEVGLAA